MPCPEGGGRVEVQGGRTQWLVLDDHRLVRVPDRLFHLASLLDRLVDDASVDGFADEDRSEARRILYSPDAILRLHFAQEEELLTSITLDGPPER